MFQAEPPCLKNGHGSFTIGEWVEFTMNRPDWKGDTAGDIRHNGEFFFIRTCNNGPLLIGLGGVDPGSIRKPRASPLDKLVKSMGRR